ncbi:SMI1/KNR4 family protein [Kallotenue papyrolyticum]|uniref:SMI1/KNR4 family protein n=1 Tax=Kallotenue papyrolyticum TaxID=1325125 RepID=UPI0009DD9CB9|nr:SMI1/KNR4 family protein [Kallotenue papyrolyticum]
MYTSIQQLIDEISKNLDAEPPATEDMIREAESLAGYSFPEDYKSFLMWSNGSEGQVGGRYVSLWNVGRLRELNDGYGINLYLPGVLAIGTDGGGQGYALDFRSSATSPAFIQVPLGDLNFDSITILEDSFFEGMRRALMK